MKVLSLFDGMSCGRIALDRAGINVTSYHASELDKYAIKVTQANWPETVQLGDVTKWREWDIDWNIDLLIGGSPCQGFSFAGKQLAFDDPRSKLFFVYVDILKHIRTVNPNVKFMLENVKMKKEYLAIISEQLGVKPVFINSALVSAQNRQRFYWANWKIEQPNDRGLLLAGIIDSGIIDREKSFCIDANYHKGGNLKSYFEKNRRQLVFELSSINQRCIDITINDDGIRPHKGDARKSGISELGRLVFKDAKKTYTVTTSHMPKIIDELGYRKLTPIECERLQTVPDNYTNHVSNTQRYKMLGNGWTVDVIAHIFKQGLNND
jgi:DNA-cytosine methyltransferase